MAVQKRSREDDAADTVEMEAMANCLMLFANLEKTSPSLAGRSFTCKTCNRQFSSFQALGGHRASHKKPRLVAPAAGGGAADLIGQQDNNSAPKQKTHACSICGLEFPLGQALGGHMRRHRAAASVGTGPTVSGTGTPAAATTTTSVQVLKKLSGEVKSESNSTTTSSTISDRSSLSMVPVMKRSFSNSKRVALGFDLNLTPYENHMQSQKR